MPPAASGPTTTRPARESSAKKAPLLRRVGRRHQRGDRARNVRLLSRCRCPGGERDEHFGRDGPLVASASARRTKRRSPRRARTTGRGRDSWMTGERCRRARGGTTRRASTGLSSRTRLASASPNASIWQSFSVSSERRKPSPRTRSTHDTEPSARSATTPKRLRACEPGSSDSRSKSVIPEKSGGSAAAVEASDGAHH